MKELHRFRGLMPLSLRMYATTILHFVRWWSKRPGADVTHSVYTIRAGPGSGCGGRHAPCASAADVR
jgi:hypothetical protein